MKPAHPTPALPHPVGGKVKLASMSRLEQALPPQRSLLPSHLARLSSAAAFWCLTTLGTLPSAAFLCGCSVTFDTAPVFTSAGACLAVALSGPGDHRHTTASESFEAGEELQMSSLPVAYIHTMHILYCSIHCQYTTWPFTVKTIPTILCFASQELLIFSVILFVATTLTLV